MIKLIKRIYYSYKLRNYKPIGLTRDSFALDYRINLTRAVNEALYKRALGLD